MTTTHQSTTEGGNSQGLPPEGAAFSLSDSAARRILKLMESEKPGTKLRVSVAGGGCSGFQYIFDFDAEQQADDLFFEKNGASVVIDPTSLELVKGSMLDFVETLGESYFSVKNPNATGSCGCGNSFAL